MVDPALLFSDLTYQNVFLAVACFCVVGLLIGTVVVAGVIYSIRKYLNVVEDEKFRFLLYGVIFLEASFILALINASAPPLPTGVNYVPNLETATLAFEISAHVIIFAALRRYFEQFEGL